VWQDTSEGDSGANEGIEFFVTANGKLEMARSNALDLEILGSVSSELENFSSQIFEDCSNIDGSLGSNAHLVLGVVLQETLDTTAGELESCLAGVALLLLSTIVAALPSGALSTR